LTTGKKTPKKPIQNNIFKNHIVVVYQDFVDCSATISEHSTYFNPNIMMPSA
jgi:L-fucose isomerase-like protein